MAIAARVKNDAFKYAEQKHNHIPKFCFKKLIANTYIQVEMFDEGIRLLEEIIDVDPGFF